MTPATRMAPEQLDRILSDAIEEGRRLVLTHQTPQGWRAYKGRFAGGSAAADRFRVLVPQIEDQVRSSPPQPGETLGLTFRVGHKKSMFATRVESVESGESDMSVSLQWPRDIKQLQRRAYVRAAPPRNAVIPVRIWRVGGDAGPALEARQVRHAQLEDLSAGGLRVIVANPGEFEIGATYRCVFAPRPGKPSIIVETLVRHREASEGGRGAIGFQFVGLETTAEGRRALDRIARTVSQFQRARSKLRRARVDAP